MALPVSTASPRTRFGAVRRLPRRPILVILALLGTLIGASVARAANPPSITGPSGPVNTPPSFTITGLALSTINWTLDGTGIASGSGLSPAHTGPLGGADGPYTLHATQTPLDPVDPTSGEATVSFTLDTVAPTVTASATKADASPYAAGTWTNQAVTVHYTCSDSGSGVASCPPPQLFATTGTFTASGTVLDNAGNSAPASFGPIQIDTAPPTGGALAHAPVANQVAGFTKTASVKINLTAPSSDNVTVRGAITYALSGTNLSVPAPGAFQLWTGTRPFTVTASQGASTTVFLWARDVAGNSAPVASTAIIFDNQPPFVTNSSFPLPGLNLTTAFGSLANVRINFNEPVQNPASLIRMCVNPCGLPIAAAVTYGEITGPIAILDPLPATPTAGLAVGTTYSIELPTVRDPAGNILTGPGNTPWTFTTSTDGTPPGPVTNLTAVPGIGQVALSWTRPPDADLARITVLRGTTPPASPADATAARFSLAATATSFTDLGLTPGVTYHYAVYAEDAVGNPSGLVRSSAVPKFPLVLHPKPPNTISARSMRPKKGKVLVTLRPLMRWKATRRAPFYNLQIVDLSTNKKVVSVFPRAPRYRVAKNRLKAGHRYAWRVWSHRRGPGWYSVKRPMTSWFDVSPKAKK